MEEIDLKELFEFLVEKVKLIIFVIIGVCILGCCYGLFLQTPKYQSYTTVILGGNEAGSTSGSLTYNDITLNKNLVGTYSEIVKSRRVLDQVIAELNLELSYESLASKISVGSVNQTEIIKITVTDEEPVTAKNIANVTANYFTKEIVVLYNMNNVNILDEAIASESPSNINFVKQLILYLAVGLVLGLGIAFVIFYFDRTIKSVEQVEQKIQLPILGSVQKFGNGGTKK